MIRTRINEILEAMVAALKKMRGDKGVKNVCVQSAEKASRLQSLDMVGSVLSRDV